MLTILAKISHNDRLDCMSTVQEDRHTSTYTGWYTGHISQLVSKSVYLEQETNKPTSDCCVRSRDLAFTFCFTRTRIKFCLFSYNVGEKEYNTRVFSIKKIKLTLEIKARTGIIF